MCQAHVGPQQVVHDLVQVRVLLLRDSGDEVSDFVIKIHRKVEFHLWMVELAAFCFGEVVLFFHYLLRVLLDLLTGGLSTREDPYPSKVVVNLLERVMHHDEAAHCR